MPSTKYTPSVIFGACRLRQATVVFALISLLVLFMPQMSVHAGGPWYVAPDGNDSNDCLTAATACQTITAAISKASSGDTINVAAGTYFEQLQIFDKPLDIRGEGLEQTIVDAQRQGRVLLSANDTGELISLSGMTLRGGSVSGLAGGGGIFNSYGTLALTDIHVIQNTGGVRGGGIRNDTDAVLTLNRVVIGENTATGQEGSGGGLYNEGTLIMTATTVISNTTTGPGLSMGGGVFNTGIVTATQSAIIFNRAGQGGGFVSFAAGSARLENVTISTNTAAGSFSGLDAGFGSGDDFRTELINVTISNNVGGSAVYGSLKATNTIIANNSPGDNCDRVTMASGSNHNLDSGNTCGLTGVGDLINTDPKLGPLQNNGGSTFTHALLPGSPAIDAGTNDGCPATDQRGVARPFDGDANSTAICDIGAYEVGPGSAQHRVYLPLVQRTLTPPTIQSRTPLALGFGHSCALTNDNGLKCWGRNGGGELGDGTNTPHLTPADVSGLTSGVSAISAGDGHTCALTSGNGIKCWGIGVNGELGDGARTNRNIPVDVSGLTSGVSAVSAASGGNSTCALTNGGGAKCWGSNVHGQLGDGTTMQRLTPVDVSGLTAGVTAIVAGGDHTCALMNGGGVKCWGSNLFGQLGDGTTTQRLTPVDVSGLATGVSGLAVGYGYTCALMDGGGIKCWGFNHRGQLGDGTTIQRLTPVDVSGLTSGVSAVAVSGGHTCALTDGGGVKCWGDNRSGQIGDGTTTDRPTPVDVSGLNTGVTAIATGFAHSCALTNGGDAKCWGRNTFGQLGDGTTDNRLTPVDVSD